MFRRSFRSLLIGVTVAIAALAATQPVFADTVVGQSGTVGAWSVVDTSLNPAAIGKYRYYASDGFGWWCASGSIHRT